ncbi:response regulator [Dryocola clanedunensis]|uniref:response regulator n=1 Tax=Cedecea sulfonylureivorans TaxID=3051154 RepID=UPI0019288E68|nr:response regulator [Cedecea sulfonylureivorans]
MTLPQRIAIVDDEPSVRSGLSNLLRSDGYSTVCFASAEALLADPGALTDAALLVIDIKLKGMSGFELFNHIKNHAASAAPVIFISGHGDEQMQRYALDRGAAAFLRKPIDIEQLLNHIQNELRSGKT